MLCWHTGNQDIPNMQDMNRLAAVDLGSNSFRLEIGKAEHGRFCRTDYLKETVRQGGGLDADVNLTPQAMQRGWECLARFGEHLCGFDPTQVRAVATQTLREARNRDVFLQTGERLLGFPIEVISGLEEARLIYQGVAQDLPQSSERRLVIDIGGRSTELILGQGCAPHRMHSYAIGSVTWSMRYFPEGQFSTTAFQTAEMAACDILNEAIALYCADQWDLAYGSAGTINAVVDVLAAAGWPPGHVSQNGLDWLQQQLLVAEHADRLHMAGMRDDRRAVIGGGLSVLRAVFKLLGIQQLDQATGGLRHGVLLELMARHRVQPTGTPATARSA